ADGWTPPEFPASGKHVLAAGVSPGPDVAAILAAVEEQWIAEGFPPDERVMELIRVHSGE
ncbi:MAG: hypothetical protein ACX939_13500, partial [Hyphococcus sp.]